MSTLPTISPEVIKAYHDEIAKNQSPATAKRKEVSLNRFFDWASTQGHIPANPNTAPVNVSAFSVTPKKSNVPVRTWAIVGITSSMAVLVFLLLYKLQFPIQFIKSFAQESKIQTSSNQDLTGQTLPQDASPGGSFPASSAVNQAWNLYAKLKLTDQEGTPMVGSQTMSFKLFDASANGTALYTSEPQSFTTDQDGSTLISLASVPSSLFFQNNTLYLEPQVASASGQGSPLSQRIPISTASTPAVDLGGNIVLTSESPSIKAKQGNLLIEGQTVTVKTTDGGGGNIEFNPDANGYAHFLFEGNRGNFLNAQGPNLTSGSLYYGMVPNNATGYDLIRLQSGAPKMKTRFSVDALGNTYIAGNENVVGNIATNGTDRLTSAGALENITGYSQNSGNFVIKQNPGDFATINKTVTSGSALSDVLTLTLDERGKPATSNSDYSTLVLNRYDGNGGAAALKVNTGNAIFNGQVELGRFTALPGAIGQGSLVFNTSDNKVYVWDGTTWVAVGSGGSSAFDAITSGTNTTATMIVGTGASLTYSGTGSITASDLVCATAGCVSNSELANSAITINTAGILSGGGTVSLGGSINLTATEADTLDSVTNRGATTANAITVGNLTDSGLTANKGVFTDGTKQLTSTGTLGADQGGTGYSVYAVGDILYADTTATLAKLADIATGNALISGGVGVAPSWGKIVLGTHTTGNYVSSIAGTSNQIDASAATGDVTLSIPSDFRAPGTVNAVNGLYTGATAGTQRIDASGNLVNIGTTQFNTVTYTWPGTATAGYVLQSGNTGATSTLSWVDPATMVSASIPWFQGAGILYPKNNTTDVLIGSNATSSAKFAFTGVDGGLPTASIAGNVANVATYLTGNGNLATTNAQNLTLGGATTGNVIINSRGSAALTADGANLTAGGTFTLPNSNTLTGIAGYTEFSQGIQVDSGNITTTSLTANLLNTTATTINFGGAATTFNIGPTGSAGSIAFSGGSTDTGCTLDGTTGNLICSGNITATGDLVSTAGNLTTTSVGTATVFNTNATTVNIGGAATTVSIGAATGTTTINNGLAVTGDTNLNGNTTIGNAITDNITFTGRVANGSSLIPIGTVGTNDLGSLALPWDNIYGVALFQNGNAVCDATGAGCPFSGGYWSQSLLGVLFPTNNSVDLLIGGDSTVSAKFAFTGVDGGLPTASIAGNVANVATYLTGNGNLSTTNAQNLTLGGATTGNVIINSRGSAALTADGANLTGTGTYTFPNTNTLTGVASYLQTSQGLSVGGGTTYHFDSSGNIVANDVAANGGNLTTTSLTANVFNATATTLNIGGAATTLNIGPTGSAGSIALSGGSADTGCTLDGTTGNFTCSGNITTTATTGTQGFWAQNLGALYPINSSVDLLIGASATTSAKFAFTNILTGTPTMDVSAQATNIAIKDNTTNALQILEVANPYLAINTNDAAENMSFGNTTTNPTFSFLGTGNTTMGGDLAVNGGDLTTTQTTANLFTNATTLGIGAATGTTTINNALAVTLATNLNGDTTIGNAITDNITFTGRVAIDSDLIPIQAAASTNDLGTALLPWDNIYGVALFQNGNAVCDSTGANCPAGSGFWAQNLGALYPTNNSVDLLIGSSATTSAKFAFTGVDGGLPTASIAGNVANVATYLTGNGNLATTNAANLTIGGATTGNVIINSRGSAALTADGANLTGTGTYTFPNTNTLTGVASYLQFSQGISVGGATTYHFDSSGNIVANDVAANGGNLTTTAAAGYVFNANATTLHIGEAGTTISIGAGTGTTTINNTSTVVTGNLNVNGGTIFTAAGNLSLQPAGIGVTANVQVGAGGAGSTTPDLLVLDIKSDAGDPAGTNGAMYYNATTNKMRCYQGSWADCGSGSTGSSNWTQDALGVLYPNSQTTDVLIGGVATTSAKFAFTGVDGGLPTASIAGNVANVATYLTGNGNLATTNAANLTIGGATTGNVIINSRGSAALTADGANLTGTGTYTFPNTNTLTGVASYLQFSQGISVGGATTYHFDSSGNIVANDVAANGGNLTTTSVGTATVFNTNATTLNIGGAATTVGIGAGTGTTTINNALAVTGNTNLNGDTTIGNAITDNITFSGRVAANSSLIPIGTAGTNDLGTALLPWDNIYGVALFQNGNAVCDSTGANCPVTSGSLYWGQSALGVLYPLNNTVDLLIGADSTASAKFAFTNIFAGTPTLNVSNQATNISIRDNTTNALQILEGVNAYLALNTNNGTENISFGNTTTNQTFSFLGTGATTMGGDLAVNGGNLTTTAATANLFTTAPTLGIGALTGTVTLRNALTVVNGNLRVDGTTGATLAGSGADITFSGANSHSISNSSAGTDLTIDAGTTGLIQIGNTSTGNVEFAGGSGSTGCTITNATGDLACAGNLTAGGDVAANSGNLTTTSLTASIFNATATTLNLGGAATTLNIGPTGASGSIALSGGSADTGCTLNGVTGALTCSGNITSTATTGTQGFWAQNLGALYPINNSVDLLIGSSATTSAKFAFTGVDGGLPTASIAGNIANVATFIDGNGNISTTNRQNLVLGNSATYDSTGNILLNPNGTDNVGIGTTVPTAMLDVAGAASISGSLTFRAGAGSIQTTVFNPLTIGGATTGNIFLQPDGTAVTGQVQIGAGGGGSTTPDLLVLDVKSDAGDPTGTNGSMYYNADSSKMRCFQAGAWADCGSGGAGGTWTLDGANGVIYPNSQTVDVLIGSNATASAKFAFKNILTGTPTMDVSLQATNIAIKDNTTNALQILEGANAYLALNTNNGTESISFGNATTNPSYTFLGTGIVNFNGGSIASPADLTITPSGGQLILADTATLNVGGTTNVGYNAFANAIDTPAATTAITSDNDLFVGGDLEVKGGLYLTGKNIFNLVGTTPTATISLASDPSLINRFNTLGNGSWVVNNDANTGIAALIVNQSYVTPDIFNASAAGVLRFKIANNGTTTITTTNNAATSSLIVNDSTGTGTGKIDVGTVDPPYTINGDKFATFFAGMVGVKEETAGLAVTDEYVPGVGYRSVIDFNNLPTGSDLWLFGKTTNIKENMDKLVALLTPSSATRVWYDIDKVNKRLVIYSARPTEISYRLTGPRFDAQNFPNQRSADNPVVGFVLNSLDAINNSPIVTDVQGPSLYVLQKIQDGMYTLKDPAGVVVDGIESIGNFVAGNIRAGMIDSQLLIADSINAASATINNLTINNQLFAPLLATKLISPVPGNTDITVRLGNEATSSGKLAVQDNAGNEVASIDSAGNARLAGDLQARQANFAGDVRAQNIDKIQSLLNQVALDQSILLAATSAANINATGSANISQLIASDLYVTGHAAISSLLVNDNLTAGNINSLSTPLKLQSLAMAPVEIMNGLVTIDTHGNVNIAGDLNIAGKITAPEIDTGIINASGSATFNSVSTGGLIIGAPDATASGVVANGEINTNSTIGKAIIPAGVSEITIKNPKVTDYTLVYVTPTSDTQNNVLYIKSKQNGQFTVGFTNPINLDANFNWWIVQIQ